MSLTNSITFPRITPVAHLSNLQKALQQVFPYIKSIRIDNGAKLITVNFTVPLPSGSVLDALRNIISTYVDGTATKDMFIEGNLTVQNLTTSSKVINVDETDAINNYTGSLILKGGLAIAKQVNVAGLVTATGGITIGAAASLPASTTINGISLSNYIPSVLSVGSGLQKVGNVFSLLNDLPNVVSLGTLTSLTVSGNANFLGKISVPSPLASTDAASKGYVDSVSVTAGTGLVKSGTVLSVNTVQSHVTSVGTLNSLAVSGTTTLGKLVSTDTAQSTSSTSGSFTIAGGLGVAKNVYIGGVLGVTGTTVFSGAVTVPAPNAASSPTTKSYVDATIVTAGTGLTKTGTVLSVNASLPNVTLLGTLSNITVSGAANLSTTVNIGAQTLAAYITSIVPPYSAGTGLVLTGQVFSASPLQTLSGLTVNGTTNLTTDTYIGSQTLGEYISSRLAAPFNVGTGLTLLNNTLTVDTILPHVVSLGTLTGLSVSGPTSLSTDVTIAGIPLDTYIAQNVPPSTAYSAGSGLVLTGTTFSLNANLPDVISVGNLTSLNVVGGTNLSSLVTTDLSQSTNSTTGSVTIAGGVGIAKNLNVGGSLVVNGSTTFTGTVTVPNPVNSTDASSKGYVDGLVVTPGVGLIKSGNVLSVHSAQNQITQLGTLNVLYVSGTTTLQRLVSGDTSQSTSSTSGSVTIAGGLGVGKNLYVGGIFAVAGTSSFTGSVTVPTPVNAMEAATKAYVDTSVVTAGTGLTRTGTVMSVNSSQTGITTLGTLTALTVTGTTTLGRLICTDTSQSTNSTTGSITVAGGVGILKNLFVGQVATFGSTSNFTSLATFSGGITGTAGTTILGSTTTGSLTSSSASISTNLTVSGYTTLANVGANVVTAASISTNLGLSTDGTLFVAGTSTLNGRVTVPTPVNATDAATKAYADSLAVVAGAGLIKTGATLSVSASQPQITSVGTLTSLSVTGISTLGRITSTDATQSTNSTTGSVTVAGGLGVARNLYIGGVSGHSGLATFSGGINGVGGSTVLGTLSAGSVSATSLSLSGSLSALGYCYLGDMSANVVSVLALSAAADLFAEGTLNVIGSSTLNGPVTLGTMNAMDVSQSTSITTGAITIAGGLGIAKNTYIGGALVVTGTSSFTGAITVPPPIVGGNPTTKTYVDGLIVTAGTGLTKSGTMFSVNNILNHVTTVGTLTSLTVSGTSSLSTLTASATNFGSLTVSGTSTFTGAITVPTPTISGNPATKAYVDGLVNTPGIGLSKSGTVLSVNPNLSHVTGLGTLTSLNVTGTSTLGQISATSFTESSSTSTGALVVSGGLGVGKSTFTNQLYVTGTEESSDNLSGALQVTGGATVNKNLYVGGNLRTTYHTISSNGTVPPAPNTPSSATYYVDPVTNKSVFVDSVGKRHIMTDSMTKKGDMLAYSQSSGVAKIFGAGTAGTVLTADPSSDFGFAWRGVDVNNADIDPQMAKFCYVYTMSDQVLTTSEFNSIKFYTDGVVDRAMYELPIVGGRVTIREEGVYSVFANVDAMNESFSNTTTVQWSIQYDIGRTGNFTTATDSYSYTTHTSTSSGTQAVMVYAFINVNSTDGAEIRVIGQIVSGSSSIKVLNSTSNLTVMQIPGSKSVAVMGAGTGYITTSYSNVYLSTSVYIDTDTYTYINGQSSVTILSAGSYFVYAKLTLRKSSGTDHTAASIRLVTGSSGTYIPATVLGSGPLTSGSGNTGKETISWWGIVYLNANDTIRIQAQTDVGTNVFLHGAESGIYITDLPLSTYPSMLTISTYTGTQSTVSLSSTWLDVPYQFIRSQQLGQGITITGNTTFTVMNQGVYILSGTIVADNPRNITGRILYGQILTSVDNGDTWYPLLGGVSMKSCSRRTGLIVNGIMQLMPGTMIKCQIKTNGSTSDNITVGDGTNLAITCYEHITQVISSFITFGTYYLFTSSSDNYVITSTVYTEKMRLTTKVLPAGVYRISLFGAMSILSSGATANVKMTLVGPDKIPVVLFTQQASFFKTGAMNMSQVNVIPVKYGITHFILEVNASSANSASVQNMMIELFRLT